MYDYVTYLPVFFSCHAVYNIENQSAEKTIYARLGREVTPIPPGGQTSIEINGGVSFSGRRVCMHVQLVSENLHNSYQRKFLCGMVSPKNGYDVYYFYTNHKNHKIFTLALYSRILD